MAGSGQVPVFHGRRRFVIAGFFLLFTGLTVRAAYLQVVDNSFLQRQADVRHQRVTEVSAHRGVITDRNNQIMAVSTPVQSLWANPALLLEDRSSLPQLAKILDLNYEKLLSRLTSRANKEFVFLGRRINPEKVAEVLALNLSGVNTIKEYKRYYPAAEISSHVLGFCDIDDRGQEGLELTYNDWLEGQPGKQRVIKDRKGRTIEYIEQLQSASAGQDLNLSLDLRLQYLAYRELKAAVKKHAAISGSIVVLDPATGEILALVNQPSFNPNNRVALRGDLYRNRALTDVFEPGSTIKPFTVAAALEGKRYQSHSAVNTSPGLMRVSGHAIRDSKNHGRISVSEILKKSSNVGATKLALDMEAEELWQQYQRFGIGAGSGSGFVGESSGFLPHHNHWNDLTQATLSFGYGLNVTPLQLARAYSVFAAGGILRPSSFHLLDGAEAGERVLSQKTSQQVLKMLESVVDKDGTGKQAAVRGYRVAGKTGTARKSTAGGYSEDRYMSVFAGMAPVSDPRFVMVVVINEPTKNGYYGGEVAAPVFSNVMSGALRLFDIAPDKPDELQIALRDNRSQS